MKFNELFQQYLNEADVERLAQQDPREVYSDEEVKNMDNDPELMPETGPQEAFKTLEDALGKFYALGQKGLGGDAAAIHDKVYNMLQQHKVDQRDIQRFSDALTSIILGQSMRGYADSQD